MRHRSIPVIERYARRHKDIRFTSPNSLACVSSHRTGLPDRLLRLFGPRAPLPPYKGPPKRPPKLAYTGIAQVGAVALAAAAGGVWLVLR